MITTSKASSVSSAATQIGFVSLTANVSSTSSPADVKLAPETSPLPYNEDDLPEYTPMPYTISEIRAAIPSRLFARSTSLGMYYLVRDLAIIAGLWYCATWIDPIGKSATLRRLMFNNSFGPELVRWSLWAAYWWYQGLAMTGLWVIGHEAGHGAVSTNKTVCDIVGYFAHTVLWTPYFSWQYSHKRHHAGHSSIEKDETFVPKTRSEVGLPHKPNHEIDWEEYFGDTPLYTLFQLVRQQVIAFPAYLLFNVSGQKDYPKWTNHFDPSSILFTPSQRNGVIASDIGMFLMVWLVTYASSLYGSAEVFKYYGLPWFLVSHWFVMITYLHHTDKRLPHYRKGAWTFQRGAACTVDRPFLGWQGRFFLHDIAHYHVAHHFFPTMPFWHGEEATQYLKSFIGEHYLYDDRNIWGALWQTYNDCQFVEDEGEVVFYRNKKGEAVRRPAKDYVRASSFRGDYKPE